MKNIKREELLQVSAMLLGADIAGFRGASHSTKFNLFRGDGTQMKIVVDLAEQLIEEIDRRQEETD